MDVLLSELLAKAEERQTKRDKVQRDLDALVDAVEKDGSRDLTEEEESRSKELFELRAKHDKKLVELTERIQEEKDKLARRNLMADARKEVAKATESRDEANSSVDMDVIDEPNVYGPGSPNSFYADLYYTTWRSPLESVHQAALERQRMWSHEVEVEVANGSKLGKEAEKQFREHFREGGEDWKKILHECRSRGRVGLNDKGGFNAAQGGVESRALATGGGATASAGGGGVAAFVTPIFTEPEYVPYREFGRAFADECTKRPLPAYGMTIYMPQVTSAAAVTTNQTEGSSVVETDPGQGYISAGLIIVAGQVTTSQAVLDRTGPNFEYDVVIWDQLQRDYAQKFDIYVITQALANATSQTYNNATFKVTSTSAIGGLYGQVSQAKSTIRTTAGTVLNPNRVVMDPVRWEAVAAYTDSTGRPLVTNNLAGPFNAAAAGSQLGDVGIEGPTGYRFNSLPVVTDHNLPTTLGTVTADQVIVADMTQTWVYEGNIVHRVLPQTLAGNLQVIFQQYSYATVLQRYNAAVVKVNGSALAAPTFNN